jgi:ATP-binding cassette subfamily B protein
VSTKEIAKPQAAASTAVLENYVESEDFRAHRPSLSVVFEVVRDLAREKRVFFLGVLLVLVGTGASLYEPRLFGRAIDLAVIPKDYALLERMALLYFGVVVLRVSGIIGQQYVFEVLAQRMMQRLRMRVFSLYQRLPVSTYDRTPVGRLITRLTNDTASMSEMFSSGFVTFFGNLLFIFGTLAWIFYLNWRLAIASVCVFPFLVFFAIRFSKRLVRIYRESRMRISALNAFLAENILGMKIVHLFNRVPLHLARFRQVNEAYAESQIASVRVYAYFQPLITWCSGAGVALVVAIGGGMALHYRGGAIPEWSVFRHPLTPGELITFISYLLALFQPVREVVDRWTIFLSGLTSAERIYSLLSWETELAAQEAESPVTANLPTLRGEIEFRNVWFAYDSEHWVLRDFSLRIMPGQKIGIVGHTGAGKTTLISLLLRFYEPQRGQIFIDGKEIREYSKRGLRDRIGVIQQDVFLFSGRIEDNMTLWRDTPVESALSQATRDALARMGFAKDPAAALDERGSNLSMGERQILAFARAIEKRPDLWILDEATANVDSETEKKLGRELDVATQGKTLIMIAHRLATIRKSDVILVLHRGELVEQGDHASLLRKGGYYARLHRYQEILEAGERAQASSAHENQP